jgi:hypothetical protein
MPDSNHIWQPKALAETLHESFSKPLPPLNKKAGIGAKASTSSEANNGYSPPKVWLDRPIEDYTKLADNDALAKNHVQQVTVQNCMPALERTHFVQCEADLIRPSALYFLHPVHMALTALHPNINIICRSESSAQKGSRPDIVYEKNGRAFAILEYKVTGVMVKQEFGRAIMAWDSTTEKIQAKVGAQKLEPPDLTHFGDNTKATIVMKQVTKYVDKQKTNYAAVFDWDCLFLSIYHPANADVISGTFISRRGPDANNLRKAYLGWLMEAFNNDGQPDPNGPPRPGPGAGGSDNSGSDKSRSGGGASGGPGGDNSGHDGDAGPGGSGGGSGGETRSGGKGSDKNTRELPIRNEQGGGDKKSKQAAAHPGRAAPHSRKATAAPPAGKTPAHSMRSSTPTNDRPAQPTTTGAPTTAGLPHRQAPGNHGAQAQQTPHKQQQGQQPISASKQQHHQQSKPAHPPAQTHGQQPTGQAPRANAAPVAQQKTRLTTNAAPAQQRAPGRVARTEQGAGSQRR